MFPPIARYGSAFLAVLLGACGSSEGTDPGGNAGLQFATTTTGTQPDDDGYTIVVDGSPHGTIGPNDQVTVTDIDPGDHTVELSQIQFNCATLGAFTRPVTLSASAGAAVDYSVQCDDSSRSRISYSTDIFDAEIFVANADGTDPQSLTDLVGAIRVPNPQQPVNWSGDGSKMAFTRADSALYMANADGTGVVQLAPKGHSPIWTQDGRRVAFLRSASEPSCSVGDVFVVEPGVSDPVQVTRDTCIFYYDYAASGGIMAFEYSANGLLATIREDGTDLIPITDPNVDQMQHPSLSPDGSMVAYFARSIDEDFDQFGYDIFVSPTDGSSPPVNIAHASGLDFFPVWSPDGTRIAYANSPDVVFGRGSIYVVDVDGSHRTRLTPEDSAAEPTWSPDGTRIAYSGWVESEPGEDGTVTGEYHVYVANADGSGRVDITPNGSGMRPSWTGR
jgi:Tol biopolymer transport system component